MEQKYTKRDLSTKVGYLPFKGEEDLPSILVKKGGEDHQGVGSRRLSRGKKITRALCAQHGGKEVGGLPKKEGGNVPCRHNS